MCIVGCGTAVVSKGTKQYEQIEIKSTSETSIVSWTMTLITKSALYVVLHVST